MHSTSKISLLYGKVGVSTDMMSFHYTSGVMRLNEVHLNLIDRGAINTFGIDIYQPFDIDFNQIQ